MDKAFIFDWSGTLSNNTDIFLDVCRKMFVEFGKEPLGDDEIKRNFTLPYMTFWNKYFPDLSKEKQDAIYQKYIHQAGEPQLHPNVKEVINYLQQTGFKLFILSSDHLSTLLPEVEKSGLSNLITKVVGAAHEKKEEIVSLVKEFGLDKNKTFYVGDTSGDVEAGKFAQVKTIGISWGFQHIDVLASSKPDYLIDDIIEIRDIVENL